MPAWCAELVEDRASDLVGELVGIGEVGLERQPEERDLVRERHQVGPYSTAGTPS